MISCFSAACLIVTENTVAQFHFFHLSVNDDGSGRLKEKEIIPSVNHSETCGKCLAALPFSAHHHRFFALPNQAKPVKIKTK